MGQLECTANQQGQASEKVVFSDVRTVPYVSYLCRFRDKLESKESDTS
jgi:hypothetical protein